MGSIFKEVDNAILNTQQDEKRLNLLKQVHGYIMSGKWEKKPGGAKPVLDTIGMKYKDACNILGLTENGYKTMVKRASDRIRELIGEDTVRKIAYGDEAEFAEANISFNLGVLMLSPDKYIIEEVCENTPKASSREYNLLEIEDEVDFIKRHTKGFIEDELSKLNNDKLSFIIEVLGSNNPRYAKIKMELVRKIVMVSKNNLKK